MNTPVALVIFKRPDLTQRVFAEIARAKPPKLFIIADGPRNDRPGEADKCAATRAIVEGVDWDCDVVKRYSDVNLGCGYWLGKNISWVFDQVERAIILEDDCVPHPTFFRFCDELLERYRDDERVMHIAGSNFQLGHKRGSFSYYFSHYANTWGWASWRRAWRHYDLCATLWPQVRDASWPPEYIADRREIPYWREKFVAANQSQSAPETIGYWDYQWTFACWAQNGLSIHPNGALISNCGIGEDATHTLGTDNKWTRPALEEMTFPLRHPPFMARNKKADDFFSRELVNHGVSLPDSPAQAFYKKLRNAYAAALPETTRLRLRRLRGMP